jgi:RNA polymerase sigma-70 factor (ECF subfamily)
MGRGMTDEDRVWRERGLRDAVRAADERAWQTLYDESFTALDAYVLWRCGGLRDWADDVLQDTWLIAVRRVADFDPIRAPFVGWLRGIAGNVLRNRLRKVRHTHALPDDVPAPDDRIRRELSERIATALASLPIHYEDVLRAKYVERKSVAEIAAERMDTEKAMESLLTRARIAFRTAYGSDE